MRKAALSLLTAAAISAFGSPAANADIAWQSNLRAAHTQAKTEGKLLLLHFYSDNCSWCERLEAGSFRAPQVGEAIKKDFVPVKIHAAKNPKLTEMFKVSKFPTDVIVTTDGKTLSHSVSPQLPDRYVTMLTGVLGNPGIGTADLAAKAPTGNAGDVAAENNGAAENNAGPSLPSYARSPLPTADQVSAPNTSNISDPSIELDTSLAAKQSLSGNYELPGATAAAPPASSSPSGGFTMPGLLSGGGESKLAASRTNPGLGAPELGLDPATVAADSQPAAEAVPALSEASDEPAGQATTADSDSKPAAEEGTPELAMQGFCAVTVINENRWAEGSPEFGVIHLGKLYLFVSDQAMQTFLADPTPYTPVLNEIDVVRFFEEKRIVSGKREWGVKDPVYNRMFFFEDQVARDHFEKNYERYTDAAIEVMEKAVRDANPGT